MRVSAGRPEVTFVVPTFRRPEGAFAAVGSVLAQQGAAVEVVVVDDAPEASTRPQLEARFGGRGDVRVLASGGLGVSGARNLGVRQARAPLVALLDDDDLALPDRARLQRDALAAAPQADLCVGDGILRAAQRRFSSLRGWRWAVDRAAVFAGAYAVPSTTCFRREALLAVPYAEDYRAFEDCELLLRFLGSGRKAVVLPEPVILYDDRRPAGDDERLSTKRALMDAYMARAIAEHWTPLSDAERRAMPLGPTLHRRLAAHAWRLGDRRASRRHALAFWRARPWRGTPWSLVLRTFLASPPAPADPSS